MKIKPLKQPNSIACGPTCILMVSRYFGDNVSFRKIEQLSQYKKKDGVTDHDIVRTLKKLGYKAERLLNCTWENLRRNNSKDQALIVSWMLQGYKGHVSVVDRVTQKHIYLSDSENGKIIKMAKVHFMRLWMEYDGLWWPRIPSDIHLRALILVRKKQH